jgi:hypothetical protein
VELKVGALEETITVSGASPLVDTQSVRQQKVLSNTLLESMPTAVKGVAMLSKMVPGMSPGGAEVGGASGLYMSTAFSRDTYHGKTGIKLTYDGMQINNFAGTGGNTSYAKLRNRPGNAVETAGVSRERRYQRAREPCAEGRRGTGIVGTSRWSIQARTCRAAPQRRLDLPRRHQPESGPEANDFNVTLEVRSNAKTGSRGDAGGPYQESGAGHLFQHHARHAVLYPGPRSARLP